MDLEKEIERSVKNITIIECKRLINNYSRQFCGKMNTERPYDTLDTVWHLLNDFYEADDETRKKMLGELS